MNNGSFIPYLMKMVKDKAYEIILAKINKAEVRIQHNICMYI